MSLFYINTFKKISRIYFEMSKKKNLQLYLFYKLVLYIMAFLYQVQKLYLSYL